MAYMQLPNEIGKQRFIRFNTENGNGLHAIQFLTLLNSATALVSIPKTVMHAIKLSVLRAYNEGKFQYRKR